jgi:hypothetical protein
MSKPRLFATVFTFIFFASAAARAESMARPFISVSSVTVTEGNSGTTPFTAQVTMYG